MAQALYPAPKPLGCFSSFPLSLRKGKELPACRPASRSALLIRQVAVVRSFWLFILLSLLFGPSPSVLRNLGSRTGRGREIRRRGPPPIEGTDSFSLACACVCVVRNKYPVVSRDRSGADWTSFFLLPFPTHIAQASIYACFSQLYKLCTTSLARGCHFSSPELSPNVEITIRNSSRITHLITAPSLLRMGRTTISARTSPHHPSRPIGMRLYK